MRVALAGLMGLAGRETNFVRATSSGWSRIGRTAGGCTRPSLAVSSTALVRTLRPSRPAPRKFVLMKYIHLSLLSSVLLPAPSLAQTIDPAADPETSNTSIVVTGNRATDPMPLDRIGGSVTVLDEQILDRRQVREVSDVLRDVPGVAVGRVPGQTQLRLRGAEANHTLVLVDGIEVSDPYAGEFDFGTLIADEAARIEVLRGQQSAIYGSDAIGGVIQYITLGGRDAPGAVARIEAGSFGTLNGAARIAGYSGDLDYALSATLNTVDGTPGARNGIRDLANDSSAVSLKTTFAPINNARLTGVLRYARTDAEFNDSDANPASPTFGFQIDTPGNRFENEAVYALLRGELDLLDDRWTHALSAQIADTRRDGFASTGRSYGSEGQRLKGSYDTTLRIEAGGLTHRVTAALDVERERFRNTDPTGFAFTGRRQIDNVGLVGQYAIDLGDRASASASIRRDWNDQFADTTTYRLQASYRIAAATRVRGAVGSGVKNPSFYELYGFVDGRFIGNPDLRPEKSSGWEIGIDQSLFGERASIGVTYFESELDEEIFTSFPPPNFVASPGNRDTVSKRNGVEVFGEARFAEAWRVNGAYTYLRSHEDGAREVRRPSHTASLAVDWRAPKDAGGVTLVARYNGETIDSAFIDPSFVPVRVQLDDYFLLNVNADVRVMDNVELFGRVENLTAADYEDVFSFATPGRSFAIGARARF